MLGDSFEDNGGSDGHQHKREFKGDPSITPKKSNNAQFATLYWLFPLISVVTCLGYL